MLKFVYALSLLPLALSQLHARASSGSSSSSATSSASASAASGTTATQILVAVGASGLSYSPSDIQAPVGTVVTFAFNSTIPHSVTQSSFDNPCTPLGSNGFDSGVTQGTTFSVTVTDASVPVYFFCQVPTHCGSGMVGTINAPSGGSGSNAAFVSAAKALGTNASLQSDKGVQTGGSGAVATAGPTSGTPTVTGPAASGTAPPSSGSNSGSASGTSNSGSTSGSASGTASSSSGTASATGGSSGAGQIGVSGGVGLLSLVAAVFAAL